MFLTSLIIIDAFFYLIFALTISTESLHSGALSDHASVLPLSYFEFWNQSYSHRSFLRVHLLEAILAILLAILLFVFT